MKCIHKKGNKKLKDNRITDDAAVWGHPDTTIARSIQVQTKVC